MEQDAIAQFNFLLRPRPVQAGVADGGGIRGLGGPTGKSGRAFTASGARRALRDGGIARTIGRVGVPDGFGAGRLLCDGHSACGPAKQVTDRDLLSIIHKVKKTDGRAQSGEDRGGGSLNNGIVKEAGDYPWRALKRRSQCCRATESARKSPARLCTFEDCAK